MAKFFAITTTTENLIADVNGTAKASIIFTVTNNTDKPVRGIAKLQPLDQTQDAWLSLDGEPEKDFPAGGTQIFTVIFNKPLETLAEGKIEPEEKYPYKLIVASVVRPDEDFDEGPLTTIIKPERKGVIKGGGVPWWVFLIIGIVVLAALVVGLIFGLRSCGKGPDKPGTPTPTPVETNQVAVPPLKDFSLAVATNKLNEAKLKIKKIDLVKADGTPNQVVDQNPKAGEMVAVGSTVEITVIAAAEVPNLENQKLAQVLTALEGAGLRLGNRSVPKLSTGASPDENTLAVKTQAPLRGLTVAKDSKVDIVYACPAGFLCGKILVIRKDFVEVAPSTKFVVPQQR